MNETSTNIPQGDPRKPSKRLNPRWFLARLIFAVPAYLDALWFQSVYTPVMNTNSHTFAKCDCTEWYKYVYAQPAIDETAVDHFWWAHLFMLTVVLLCAAVQWWKEPVKK